MKRPLNIVITGASGQLGSELQRILASGVAEIGPIPQACVDAHVVSVDAAHLDIADAAAVDAFFAKTPCDVAINCAAMTNVDGCEQNEELAFAVNAHGPANLARACVANDVKLVHISTDYVFPGNEEGERVEADPTAPLSAYGRSKLAGEQAVQEAMEDFCIVRTAWLYGYVGKNFVKTMLNLARTNGAIAVVGDQWGNPTSANDLAYAILRLVAADERGLFHCTNNGVCSWFDLAARSTELAGIPCEKECLTSEEYKRRFPQSADRPHHSALANRRLEQTVGDPMRHWEEALESYFANFDELAR